MTPPELINQITVENSNAQQTDRVDNIWRCDTYMTMRARSTLVNNEAMAFAVTTGYF